MTAIEDALARRLLPSEPSLIVGRRKGVVLAVNAGPPPSVDVALGTSTLPAVRHLQSYAPMVGDDVFVEFAGPDPLVTGKAATSSTGNVSGQVISPGLELYHPSSTPFIDFHKAASPGGDSNADFSWRIIAGQGTDGNVLQIREAGDPWGRARIGNTGLGAYGWDNTFAHFGHRDRMDTSSATYAFMHHTNGTILMNASGGEGACIRYNGANAFRVLATENWSDRRLVVTGGIRAANDWVRINGAGGFHWEDYGGGWFMSDTTWIRAYNGKALYVENEIKCAGAGGNFNSRDVAFMGPSGAHGTAWAQFSHWANRGNVNSYGLMHNGTDVLLSASGAVQLRINNSWRLDVDNNGVRTNGVYLSTRGASLYLKADADNWHRVWWHGTNDGVYVTGYQMVVLENAYDHAVYVQSQTRHVNRANNAWRYSDAQNHTNFSDPKGKKSMRPIGAALGPQREKLKAITPIKFKFKKEYADPEGDRDHLGFNADELPEEVLHHREMPDGRVDKLMNTTGVLAMLWQITRELGDEAEALAARVTNLERRSA